MKLVSFNTNSIRTRLHQLEAVVERHAPEVIEIQETKVTAVSKNKHPFSTFRKVSSSLGVA